MSDSVESYLHQILGDDEVALMSQAREYTHLNGVFRKDGVYFRRLQWWFPWSTSSWHVPRWFKGGDEWCNKPSCFVIPPLGCFAVFRRQLRAMPCDEDWTAMDDLGRADYAPCGYLHGGRLDHQRHHHSATGRLCAVSRKWLKQAKLREKGGNDGLLR